MEKKIKDLADKLLKRFNLLDGRQKTLFFILLAVIALIFGYNIIYKGQADSVSRLKKESLAIKNALIKIKSQYPDINKEKDDLIRARQQLASLKQELSALESELPTQGSIPGLLNELVAQAAGYKIDFNSIRPKPAKDKKEYAELNIEMKFNSNYSDFANYINRLESPSRFLKATNIIMENMKDGFRGELDVALTLTTLLAQTPAAKKPARGRPEELLPLDIKRSPFVSPSLPVMGAKKEEYILSGILTTGKTPTAIINNEVYRPGDIIGNKTINKILPNRVILGYGGEEIILTLEKNK